MGKSRAEEMKALFIQLSPDNQIHIAIERESRTERGYRDTQNRYSRERIRQHDEWIRTHKDLLSIFNLR